MADAQVKTRVVEQRSGNSLVYSFTQTRDDRSDNKGASVSADVGTFSCDYELK